MIECEGLTKHYGSVAALRGVTVRIESGLTGLLGPNGAGKSTLISVLLGQTPATSGRACVLGYDVRNAQKMIRRRVGFMPENDCLIPGLSGAGYVCYCGRLAGMSHADSMQRAHQMLDYVGLGEARYRPAEQYSSGMKQRLKLAQALVHDPDLLFLDEPTNGMDPQGRQTMLNLIANLGRAGVSVLLSSHLLPDVEHVCRRVVIMGSGVVCQTGDIEELRKPHPTLFTVECVGEIKDFQRRLAEQKISIHEHKGESLFVELPEAGREELILRCATEAKVRLTTLRPKRSTLEDAFMAAIRQQEAS